MADRDMSLWFERHWDPSKELDDTPYNLFVGCGEQNDDNGMFVCCLFLRVKTFSYDPDTQRLTLFGTVYTDEGEWLPFKFLRFVTLQLSDEYPSIEVFQHKCLRTRQEND